MNLNGPACIKWFNTWLLTQYLMADSCRQDCLMSGAGGQIDTGYGGYNGFTGTTIQPHVTALYEQLTAVHCILTVHRTALYINIALHCTAPHFTTLHCTITFHSNIMFFHYTALNWTWLNCRLPLFTVHTNEKLFQLGLIIVFMKYFWLTVLM